MIRFLFGLVIVDLIICGGVKFATGSHTAALLVAIVIAVGGIIGGLLDWFENGSETFG